MFAAAMQAAAMEQHVTIVAWRQNVIMTMIKDRDYLPSLCTPIHTIEHDGGTSSSVVVV